MFDRTVIKVIAVIATSLTSIIGSLWPRDPDPAQRPIETRVERPQIASNTLPPATTTPPSTTTTLAPPEAAIKPRQQIPADPSQRCPQYDDLFRQYGLRPIEVFSYLAWRESRCRPSAVNARWNAAGEVTWTLNKDGSIDRGLLQINSSWKTVTATVCGSTWGDLDVLYDLDCNLRVARYLLGDGSGLTNWGIK